MRARRVVLAFILAMIIAGLIVIAESQWHIISNILGPYKVEVVSETAQLLRISATGPPSRVSIGQTINMTLTVENIASGDVQGYVLVNVTSTSNFTADAVRLELRCDGFGGYYGIVGFTATPIEQGYAYKSQTLFTWKKGAKESATLYITFNQSGEYQLKIAITSN